MRLLAIALGSIWTITPGADKVFVARPERHLAKRMGTIAVLALIALVALRAYSASSTQPAALRSSRPEAVPQLAPRPLPVAIGSLTSVITLDMVAEADPAVEVKSTLAGTVERLLVSPGAQVAAKQPLITVVGPSGDAPPRRVPMASPIAGTLLNLQVLPGQNVAIGDSIAVVSTGQFDAVAEVEPELLYRLYEPPMRIVVKIDRGPAPFDCSFGSLGTDSTAPTTEDSKVHLRCRIPLAQRVFPGVRGRMAVTTGHVEQAILVPLTAVEGSADTGFVTLVLPDGVKERRQVVLGITDGSRIEIKAGLSGGDTILDLVPVD